MIDPTIPTAISFLVIETSLDLPIGLKGCEPGSTGHDLAFAVIAVSLDATDRRKQCNRAKLA